MNKKTIMLGLSALLTVTIFSCGEENLSNDTRATQEVSAPVASTLTLTQPVPQKIENEAVATPVIAGEQATIPNKEETETTGKDPDPAPATPVVVDEQAMLLNKEEAETTGKDPAPAPTPVPVPVPAEEVVSNGL